jgi:hypothetical protein
VSRVITYPTYDSIIARQLLVITTVRLFPTLYQRRVFQLH